MENLKLRVVVVWGLRGIKGIVRPFLKCNIISLTPKVVRRIGLRTVLCTTFAGK